MEESFTSLPTSYLLGSVPAVVGEENKVTNQQAPGANLQIFPPNNGGSGSQGNQAPGASSEGSTQQSNTGWKGVFSVSSYIQYFNVDTDIVLNRLISSLYPISGDFFSKIDANPDLYGLVWISTTLVFMIASLGNCATYLTNRRIDQSTPWVFDVSYMNMAAGSIYGYALVVPLAYYFVFQYLGSTASLIRFWCLWGYSLFIFILSSFLLVIPLEFLRWTIILIAGAASASFVSLNLRSYIQTADLTIVAISAFVLQMGLSIFIKMWFFA